MNPIVNPRLKRTYLSEQELNERLINLKSKLNFHFATRNSNNIDERYTKWLEDNIQEIKNYVASLKQTQVKKVG